jgi:hypothetical protein
MTVTTFRIVMLWWPGMSVFMVVMAIMVIIWAARFVTSWITG